MPELPPFLPESVAPSSAPRLPESAFVFPFTALFSVMENVPTKPPSLRLVLTKESVAVEVKLKFSVADCCPVGAPETPLKVKNTWLVPENVSELPLLVSTKSWPTGVCSVICPKVIVPADAENEAAAAIAARASGLNRNFVIYEVLSE